VSLIIEGRDQNLGLRSLIFLYLWILLSASLINHSQPGIHPAT
jgi:hypothetical protein